MKNEEPAAEGREAEDFRELLRSHNELRAALILAGRRIRTLSFGRRDDKALPILRRTLKDARAVAKKFRDRTG